MAGATGLVGGAALGRMIERATAVTSIGRRLTGVQGETLTEMQVDFATLPVLPPSDVAVCALGTTMALAGSQAAFRAVDHDAVLAFARAARAAGVRQFILVSAVGADPASRVFYSRVKGEAERDVLALGFARVDIIQPGLILGPRAERRPVEALMQRLAPLIGLAMIGPLDRYAGIDAAMVAQAIVALAGAVGPGVRRHGNRAMRALAG